MPISLMDHLNGCCMFAVSGVITCVRDKSDLCCACYALLIGMVFLPVRHFRCTRSKFRLDASFVSRGGTPLQEANREVPLDGVAFSRLE